MTDTPESFLADGRVTDALAAVQQQVRQRPEDAKLRVLLFQLLAVSGQWTRAGQQLELCGELDASALAMVATCRAALQAELLREAVFEGRATPVVLGTPAEWVASLVEALRLRGQGQAAAAHALRERAFLNAPASTGRIDGTSFQWIADGDSRLGPVLEAVVNGRYAWVPYVALKRVVIEAPHDLRDLVWSVAHLEFVNGGETPALLFTRYPRSAAWDDERVWLARRTEWLPLVEPHYEGVGQRMFTTDVADHPMLDVREIDFDAVEGLDAAAADLPAAAAAHSADAGS